METPTYNVRSAGYWLRMPIVGPILCLTLVLIALGLVPDGLGTLLVWFLFVVGCAAVGGDLARAGRYLLRR